MGCGIAVEIVVCGWTSVRVCVVVYLLYRVYICMYVCMYVCVCVCVFVTLPRVRTSVRIHMCAFMYCVYGYLTALKARPMLFK